MDYNMLAALLHIMSAQELKTLFEMLREELLHLDIDISVPSTPSVQNVIFMAQVLARVQC